MDDEWASISPTNIVVDKSKKQLRIGWADGQEGVYPFEQLRAACPCAECKAYRTDTNPLRPALVISIGLDNVQIVGNYAIQLIWDDGHRFGIFTWDFLRSLG